MPVRSQIRVRDLAPESAIQRMITMRHRENGQFHQNSPRIPGGICGVMARSACPLEQGFGRPAGRTDPTSSTRPRDFPRRNGPGNRGHTAQEQHLAARWISASLASRERPLRRLQIARFIRHRASAAIEHLPGRRQDRLDFNAFSSSCDSIFCTA